MNHQKLEQAESSNKLFTTHSNTNLDNVLTEIVSNLEFSKNLLGKRKVFHRFGGLFELLDSTNV